MSSNDIFTDYGGDWIDERFKKNSPYLNTTTYPTPASPATAYGHRDHCDGGSACHDWCGPLADLRLQGGPDVGARPSSLRSTSNTFMQMAAPAPGYDIGWDSVTYEKKKGVERAGEGGGDGDDDNSSCSNCVITCDDQACEEADICTDDCESQSPCGVESCHGSEPCVDQDCEGARTPCTDEACFVQTPAQVGRAVEGMSAATYDGFGQTTAQPPRIEVAVAAQTLTSIQKVPAAAGQDTSNMYLGPLDFAFGGDSRFFGGNDGGMDFGAGNNQGYFGALSRHCWSNLGQYQTPLPHYGFGEEFWPHLWQHHLPSHQDCEHAQHQAPCPVDYLANQGHRCPLPNADSSHFGLGLTGWEPDCAYQIADGHSFTDHVVNDHPHLLPSLPGWSENTQLNAQPQRQGCNHMSNNHFQNTGFLPFPNNAYQHPTPGSALTVPSLASTPLPTTDSPLTSPSVEAFQRPGDFGIHPPKVKLEALQLTNAEVQSKSQGRSIGPDDAFRCCWADPETGHICLENFENSDTLDAHCKSAHTKDLPKKGAGFQCSWQGCKRHNDSFTTRAKLNRHLQTHTGFKPMQCPHCGLRLSAKQALDQHIRTHTGEHPYECKYGCGQKFKQHSALTMHHRVHTKEKPLECAVCGAKFTESSNLSKHMRTHSVKGHFDCELCDKNFHRLDQLRRHLHSNHKDQPEAIVDNIERAKGWRKVVKHEKRREMASSSGSSEPPSEFSEMKIEDDKDVFMAGV